MKKIIFMTAFLALSIPLASMGCDGRSDTNISCDEAFNRANAYKIIKDAENSNDETISDLNLVLSVVNEQTSLKESAYTFVKILNRVGNGDTAHAQQAFRLISDIAINKHSNFKTVSDIYMSGLNAENSIDDSISNLYLIGSLSSNEEDLIRLSKVFISVLNRVGNGDTANAQQVLRLIVDGSHRTNQSFEILNNSFQSIMNAENSISDTISNLNLVISAFRVCNDIKQATNELIDILGTVGNGDTAAAQRAFKGIYGL